MIDEYDIDLFKQFLKLSKTKGTDYIKVVAGEKMGEYIVSVYNYDLDERRAGWQSKYG